MKGGRILDAKSTLIRSLNFGRTAILLVSLSALSAVSFTQSRRLYSPHSRPRNMQLLKCNFDTVFGLFDFVRQIISNASV